jgi:hypothetical protein
MSPLVDYVLFNKNIPELPDSSREELEAVYREVQPIISKEVVERLTPFYRQLVDGIVSKGLGERYIVPDDDDVGQETGSTPGERGEYFDTPEASQRTPPDTPPEVSDTVNEPVELSEEPWSDLQGIDVEESTMQPYQDDRVRPDSDDVDNQEPVQLGGRRLVRSRDTMRSTRPRVVIKNHRSEPYTNNILVNVCLGATALFVTLLPR